MMPTHIFTVKNSTNHEKVRKVEFTAKPEETDEYVAILARAIYGCNLEAVHKVKYEAILTQVF